MWSRDQKTEQETLPFVHIRIERNGGREGGPHSRGIKEVKFISFGDC